MKLNPARWSPPLPCRVSDAQGQPRNRKRHRRRTDLGPCIRLKRQEAATWHEHPEARRGEILGKSLYGVEAFARRPSVVPRYG